MVEHKDDEIQWVCSPSISMDSGEPDTLKEALTRPYGYWWKVSAISEVNNFYKERSGF